MVNRASASAVGGGGGGAPSDGSSTSSSAHSSAGPFNSGSGSSSVTESSSLWQMFADNQDVTLDDFVARALRSPDTALGQLMTLFLRTRSPCHSLTHSQTQSHSCTYSHSYLSHSNATLSYPISFLSPPRTPTPPPPLSPLQACSVVWLPITLSPIACSKTHFSHSSKRAMFTQTQGLATARKVTIRVWELLVRMYRLFRVRWGWYGRILMRCWRECFCR